jgi:CHAD domain-containing protein
MNKTKRGSKPVIGTALAALATKECRSLQQALASRRGFHAGIHQARRACRRLRSLLYFLPDDPQAAVLDKALRLLIHSFSDLRDAHVTTRTARRLASSYEATLTPALIDSLENRSQALLDAALEKDPDWARRSRKARRINTAVAALNWQAITLPAAKEVLKQSAKRMKKARRNAQEKRTDTAFHRWRRRARQVRYQLDFLRRAHHLADAKKDGTHKYDARIRRLGLIIDRLGWRQDFQVFVATLESLPPSDEVLALREALAKKSQVLSKVSPAKATRASTHG